MPETYSGKRALRRRMMTMVGVDTNEWITEDEEIGRKITRKRRSAVRPFARDQRFADTRT